MSRFFATASDSETETSSEDEQVPRQPTAAYTVSRAVHRRISICHAMNI